MIPLSVLAAIRTQFGTRRLDRDAQIVPQVRVPDVSGGQTVTNGTPVAVRIGVTKLDEGDLARQQQIGDRIDGRAYVTILLPAGTAVSLDDVIVQTSPQVTYRVLAVLTQQESFEVLRRVMAVVDG